MASKILVADDSITIQKIIAMAFENEDIVVQGVNNGNDAWKKLKDFKPDIVLADVDMPGLNGFELSGKIKEAGDFSATRVLLLASDFEVFDVKRFKESQADDHISKPFKSEDIVRKVKDLLETLPPAPEEEEEVITFLEKDLEDSAEQAAPTIALSADDLLNDGAEPPPQTETQEPGILEEDELVMESEEDAGTSRTSAAGEPAADSQAPVLESTAPEQTQDIHLSEEERILEEMIAMDSMKASDTAETINAPSPDSAQPPAVSPSDDSPDLIAEVSKETEDSMDDLEAIFQEITADQAESETEETAKAPETVEETSTEDVIEPEPEDLLEQMAPTAFANADQDSQSGESRKSLSFLSNLPPEEDRLKGYYQSASREMEDQIRETLRKSVSNSIEEEIRGISETIVRSVREIVREIVPGIAREVILEEIEKTKKMEEI